MHAWRGIAVQVVRRTPRAVLIYLAVGRFITPDSTAAMGFVNVGAPLNIRSSKFPTGRLSVQPMILTGKRSRN